MNEYKSEKNWINSDSLTFADIDDIHFCLEYRSVEVSGNEIFLTQKEFDILISNIRKKLKIHDSTPEYIKSVHGVGYKFDAEVIITTRIS